MIENLFSQFTALLPSPLPEIAVAAVLLYSLLSHGERRLPTTQRQELTYWINGTSKGTWIQLYGNILDVFFGTRPFSIKCFVRSSIASVFSVLYVYFLMYSVVDIDPNRIPDNLRFWQVVVLAIITNFVPDYLSLVQTRLLFKRFAHCSSTLRYLLVLSMDIVASAAIISVWIYICSLFLADLSSSPIELVLVFSKFSVFFYSTFMVSFCAWLYWLTLLSSRLLCGTSIGRWLGGQWGPIEERPIILPGIILAVGLVATPFFHRDNITNLNLLEKLSCFLISEKICIHSVRMLPSTVALNYVDVLCNIVPMSQCNRYMSKLLPKLEKSCQENEDDTCWKIGVMYREGLGVGPDPTLAVNYFRKSCEMGDVYGCDRLGAAYYFGQDISKDVGLAETYFKRGCDGNLSESCHMLGIMYIAEREKRNQDEELFRVIEKACNLDDIHACVRLSALYYKGIGVTKNKALAVEFSSFACLRGVEQACDGLLNWCNHGNIDACLFVKTYGTHPEVRDPKDRNYIAYVLVGIIAVGVFIAVWIRVRRARNLYLR